MDPQHFDALTRRLSSAGSRRRVLTALVGGAFGRVLGLPGADEAAAKCKNPCPPEKPCCIKGKCREQCGDTCCADCFVEVLLNGNPDEDHPICCTPSGGTICEHNKPGPGDDRCCYPNEKCVKGKCCCDDCSGAINCGGECCAIDACCNGKCCEKGKVCATKEQGADETCVPANRDCDGDAECFPGETCHGGKCCSGLRICGDGAGQPVCCTAGEWCEFQGQQNAECCAINTICKSTYRGHRVRR